MPYGGIFLFYQTNKLFLKRAYVTIQALTSSPERYIVRLLWPAEHFPGPKLNDILLSKVYDIGRKLNASYVTVNPDGPQTFILIKYHGFQHQMSGWKDLVPCSHIILSQNSDDFYYKLIFQETLAI